MTIRNQQTFSISKASEATGVTKNRIREWHQKGFLKDVQMISVGKRFHRRFPSSTIGLISEINEYQKQGFTLKAAAERANNDAADETKKGLREVKENGKKIQTTTVRKAVEERKG